MPMYEFKCCNCGRQFEELVFSSNYSADEIVCPSCGTSNAEQRISAAAIGGSSYPSGSSCSSTGTGGFT